METEQRYRYINNNRNKGNQRLVKRKNVPTFVIYILQTKWKYCLNLHLLAKKMTGNKCFDRNCCIAFFITHKWNIKDDIQRDVCNETGDYIHMIFW